MAPRFFVDESDLALGKALAATHGDFVYPGHVDIAEVLRGSLDDEWLPVVGGKSLVVVTRDKRIRFRPVEKKAWIDHGVRGFVLTGKKSQSTADSLWVLEHHWAQIERLVEDRRRGPWMYAVTAEHVRESELEVRLLQR